MGRTLPKILDRIESEKNPVDFKESLLKINQLYFDGLVEKKAHPFINFLPDKLKVLEALFDGTQRTVSSFYREKKVPFDEVLDIVIPYKSELIKYGSKNEAKQRHLEGDESFVEFHAKKIKKVLGKKDIDLIIPVAAGGFESAFLISDYLGVDNLFPVRYSSCSRNDKNVLMPNQMLEDSAEEKIYDKNILIVDDFVSTGNTTQKLLEWTKEYNPKKILFTFIASKPTLLKKLGLSLHPKSNDIYLYSG